MKKQSLNNNQVIQNNHELRANDLSKMVNKTCKKRQLGFMIGEGVVPDDIHWGDDEIIMMFEESVGNNQ